MSRLPESLTIIEMPCTIGMFSEDGFCMLVFIDESGNPHVNDPSSRPVVAAVCFDEWNARNIGRRLYAMKRNLLDLQQTEAELKGKKLLKQKSYLSSNASRRFAEDFFAALSSWGITIFASIMRAPFNQHLPANGILGARFRYLLQRVELLAAEGGTYANILFDGRGSQFKELSRQFSRYLYRSEEGQSCTHIADTPAFVDSSTSAGIQIADMCAYAIRIYQENGLYAQPPSQDGDYLRAVRSWYRYIEQCTHDMPTGDGVLRYGLHRLPTGVR